ncbi:MAG: hypothetical protein GFH27_549289n253 [Chloroflexi bacterium AL-W]|nr:hypothetical protein [Chloroflexi bacterium AL-N1]NOK66985.1 hypothetical protein [Chloroflexi bacterium AL-N10]NOK74723.1 hypothetical protein [Chloroflexi bacterium AL-N5]NOK81587.1 hypothetical protein [Chloroflexi bacterium AL-W]NOK89057.1 hypothetical protein [Chloroflexi bacterium AL-N15]
MLKRLFWLTLFGVAIWFTWRWFGQRQGQRVHYSPVVQPFEPITPAIPPAPPVTEETPDTPKGVDDIELKDLFADEEPIAANAVATPTPPKSPAAPLPPEEPTAAAKTDADTAETVNVITGYCMRCKAKHVISNAVEVTTESGRRGVRGTCPTCAANMFAFLKETKT